MCVNELQNDKLYKKQFGFSFHSTLIWFDLLSFSMRIPTTALVGYNGPDLTLTFYVNRTEVPSKNPWFSD